MDMKKLILASNNINKQKEINNILADYEILLLKDINYYDEIVEDENTFEGNALKKARTIYNFTNLPTIADDSGLCVELLNGEPGVHSARYSQTGKDSDNVDKVLAQLNGKTSNAKFISVIAYIDYKGNEYIFRGEIEGEIINEKRGNNGFGYDPIFYLPDLAKTFAELSSQEKNKISHRKRALNNFLDFLENKSNENQD